MSERSGPTAMGMLGLNVGKSGAPMLAHPCDRDSASPLEAVPMTELSGGSVRSSIAVVSRRADVGSPLKLGLV